MKRSILMVLAVLVFLIPAAAGDIATFVNLGFSPDSSAFMFGQYGADSASGKPYAELYLVDTRKNDFVAKGSAKKVFDAALEPGQDCSGAFYSLFADNVGLAKTYKIDHLAPGRLLYVLLDGEEPPAALSFRDFKTEASYDVAIQKSVAEGKDGAFSSSFGLGVSVKDKEGVSKRVTAGNADLKRAGVKDYVIRRILVAPDGKTLVFVIEKRMTEKGDQSVRYMIETVKIPG
jgi:predicted secreted protein